MITNYNSYRWCMVVKFVLWNIEFSLVTNGTLILYYNYLFYKFFIKNTYFC